MFCKKCGYELAGDQIFCPVCGTEAGKGRGFCGECGTKIEPGARLCLNCGATCEESVDFAGVKKRNLALAIVLSFLTCGIYSLYWFICLTNDMNRMSGNEKDTSGGLAFLLTLVTCGIYGYYWAYRLGEKRDSLDEDSHSSGVLYLVLTFFGFGIVVYGLAQYAINEKLAEY